MTHLPELGCPALCIKRTGSNKWAPELTLPLARRRTIGLLGLPYWRPGPGTSATTLVLRPPIRDKTKDGGQDEERFQLGQLEEIRAPAVPVRLSADDEHEIRRKRWKLFLLLFAMTCIAIALDVLTTYLGFQRIGPRFEQNPIGLYLIDTIGWGWLVALLALACAGCIISLKLVYWNLSLHWGFWLNGVVCLLCMFRWTVVISDSLWLLHPK